MKMQLRIRLPTTQHTMATYSTHIQLKLVLAAKHSVHTPSLVAFHNVV